MPNFSKGEVVLVRFPFTDLSSTKVRPAVVFQSEHSSQDLILVAITSRLTGLQPGEFVRSEWSAAGLNVPSAIKRAIFTAEQNLVQKTVGHFSQNDLINLEQALRKWLGLA